MGQLADLPYYLVQGLCFGAIIALIALGYSLVYGIIKLINFAHGEFYMVGAYVGFGVFLKLLPAGTSPWLAMPLIVLAAGLAGAGIAGLTEWVAYRPIRSRGRLAALLTAIGVSFFLQNLFAFVKDAQALSYPSGEGSIGELCRTAVKIGGDGIYGINLFYPVAAGLLGLGLWLLVLYTRFGRAMRAVSTDRDAAALMGVNVDSVIRRTFLLGGFLAGVAGALMSFPGQITPTMGFQPGLKAFIAAVLGGIGSVPGALVGGLALGLLEYLAVWAGVPTQFKDVASFVLLIAVLLIRPQGLLGRPEREKV